MTLQISWLVAMILWFSNGSMADVKLHNKTKLLNRPYVETYWESYLSFPYNWSNCYYGNLEENDVNEEAFGFDLKQIPVENIDVVNIGFLSVSYDPCRYTGCYSYYCGLHLYQKSDDSDLQRIEQLKSDIKHLQSQGVLVKFAYGGEEYGNTDFSFKMRSTVIYAAQRVADQVEEFGLDGVDLTQNRGFGDENMISGEQTSLQLLFLHHLREKLPADKIITYTFPGDSQYGNQDINFPYRDILRYGQNYVDVFNVYRATYKSMREMMEDFEIDPSKIVWGLAIGCNQNFADVDLGKAVETAEYVKAYGMAGVMTWSINRDTNHRIEPVGSCTDLQAGYEDGTYLKTIHSALNN